MQTTRGLKMFRLVMLFMALASFIGCTLVDPFVTRGLRARAPADPKPVPAPYTTAPVPLGEAFEYAERVKDRYRDALRDQALLQSWLGIGLIPLSAAAIGVGARGHSPDAVLGMGLAGASALGVGTWLYNKKYQLAWVAGLKAVTCAQDAMAPLNFSLSTGTTLDNNIVALRGALQTLDKKAAELETQADIAKALGEGANTNKAEVARIVRVLQSLDIFARAELQELTAKKAAAEAALTAGAELQQVLRVAGGRLVVAVNKITDEVDAIVVEAQRDPQTLATVIAGIGSSYRTLTTVPEGIAPQAAKDKAAKQQPPVKQSTDKTALTQAEETMQKVMRKQAEDLAKSLEATREAIAKMDSARRHVSDLVNSVVKDTPLEKLKGCGVAAGDIMTALSVDPADPYEITTKPGSISFTIKGGLPPYGVAVTGGVGGVSVSQAAPFSPAVTVVANKDAPDGQFAVVVSDTSGQTKTVRVKVNPGDGKQNGGEQKTTATAALNQLATKLTNEKPPISAGGVNANVTKAEVDDGLVIVFTDAPKVASNAVTDKVAEALIEDLWKKHGEILNVPKNKIKFDDISIFTKEELEKKKPQPQSKRVDQDPQFATLDPSQRKKLQAAVCLTGNDVDGQWGPVTKRRVAEYQRRAGSAKQDGVLTKDLVDKLLSLNETQIKNDCAAR